MAEYFDISDWNEKPWFTTKGSRDKSVVENPQDGKLCYFKTSLIKPGKDYRYEFWSEILASEIGQLLKLNILRYDVAYHKTEMGCISGFMNTEGESELTEGIQYLTGYSTAYKPTRKESKTEYTFQFICNALKSFDFGKYVNEIIKIIIFDSLIGNGDRHQENWGIITYNKEAISFYKKESKNLSYKFFIRTLLSATGWVFENFPKFSSRMKIKLHSLMPNRFAPIYDSGSCLGRELLEERVQQLLKDDKQLLLYIEKGTSEIHWEGKKLSHFDLIKNIAIQYKTEVETEIKRIKGLYNDSEVTRIVMDIDKNLPDDKKQYGLPLNRKELIIKMINLRYKELIKLLD